jgi:hypothetical protein
VDKIGVKLLNYLTVLLVIYPSQVFQGLKLRAPLLFKRFVGIVSTQNLDGITGDFKLKASLLY